MWQRGPAEVKRPVEIDRQILVPVVVGHRLGAPHLVATRDVDQDVETTQFADALLDGVPARLRAGDVDHCMGAVLDVGEDRGQPFLVASDAENRCALPR
jgi:hypothetical protein